MPIESANHLLLEDEQGWERWVQEVRRFLGSSTSTDARASQPLETLTPRQHEILDLIARGRDNAQIGATLGLQDKTVRNHVSLIFDRIRVENRPQAIVLAREAGLGQRQAMG